MRAALAIFLFAAATDANALPYLGDRKCAEAEVVATVRNQASEEIEGGGIVLRANFEVRKVLFGPVATGPLHVTVINDELNPDVAVWRVYLKRERVGRGGWTFAKCE